MKYSYCCIALILLLIGIGYLCSDNSPKNITNGIIFLILSFVFAFLFFYNVYKLYKLNEILHRQKRKRIEEIKSSGFKSTRKYKLNGQLFAIDQSTKQWLILNDYAPLDCMLHTFSEISSYKRQESTERVSSGERLRITKRYSTSSYTSRKVYTKLGILINLNNISRPTEYINCLGAENALNEILSVLNIITSTTVKKQ